MMISPSFPHRMFLQLTASPKLSRAQPCHGCWLHLVEETVVLPAFSVAGDTVDRYRAADAMSSACVRTQLIETPSSITVLPRDLIEDVAPTRIYDDAKYIAGVQEGRGNTYLARVTIRGVENTGGRTVNNFADTGNHNFDEALIERIEISKGPNAIRPPADQAFISTPSLSKRYSLRLMVDKLTDKKNSFPGAGARFSQPGLATADGRNIRVAATMRFQEPTRYRPLGRSYSQPANLRSGLA